MPPPTGRHQRATPPSFAQHCFEKLRLHHKLLSTFVTHRMSAVLTAGNSMLDTGCWCAALRASAAGSAEELMRCAVTKLADTAVVHRFRRQRVVGRYVIHSRHG